jgi:hypothetical protein
MNTLIFPEHLSRHDAARFKKRGEAASHPEGAREIVSHFSCFAKVLENSLAIEMLVQRKNL